MVTGDTFLGGKAAGTYSWPGSIHRLQGVVLKQLSTRTTLLFSQYARVISLKKRNEFTILDDYYLWCVNNRNCAPTVIWTWRNNRKVLRTRTCLEMVKQK
jgi:hypothetical protein